MKTLLSTVILLLSYSAIGSCPKFRGLYDCTTVTNMTIPTIDSIILYTDEQNRIELYYGLTSNGEENENDDMIFEHITANGVETERTVSGIKLMEKSLCVDNKLVTYAYPVIAPDFMEKRTISISAPTVVTIQNEIFDEVYATSTCTRRVIE